MSACRSEVCVDQRIVLYKSDLLLLLFDYYLFDLLEGTVYTAAPLSSAGLFTYTVQHIL